MERLDRLAIGVSLYTADVEWLESQHGKDWPAHVGDIVHEAIRRLKAQIKIAGFEQKLTEARTRGA